MYYIIYQKGFFKVHAQMSAYHISELESNVTEIKKRLSKLQMKKFENEEHDSRRKEECARLKENEVSINLLVLLQYLI